MDIQAPKSPPTTYLLGQSVPNVVQIYSSVFLGAGSFPFLPEETLWRFKIDMKQALKAQNEQIKGGKKG